MQVKKYKVAVLGATGAVGRQMIEVLEERNFPVGELAALASERSAGTKLPFRGGSVSVIDVSEFSFAGCDIVLGASPNATAVRYAEKIVGAGAVFIDNSSAFRMDPDVPLVIPEINAADAYAHRGIISNPNCSTIIALVAVNAINALSPIVSMTVATYQAVSGAGAKGINELLSQLREDHIEPGECSVFPHRIAFNLIPQIGDFLDNGYTTEEMKMQNEGKKILHSEDLSVSCTCVRVPVVRSHSIAISLVTKSQIGVDEAKSAVAASKGCLLVDDPAAKKYPMPLDASGQDFVLVGRIRRDLVTGGISLWCCGDQLRKGAATNAVQIAELLI